MRLFYLLPAKGWQFINDITRSNKLRVWFAPGGRIEKEQFGIDRKVSLGSQSMQSSWPGNTSAHKVIDWLILLAAMTT